MTSSTATSRLVRPPPPGGRRGVLGGEGRVAGERGARRAPAGTQPAGVELPSAAPRPRRSPQGVEPSSRRGQHGGRLPPVTRPAEVAARGQLEPRPLERSAGHRVQRQPRRRGCAASSARPSGPRRPRPGPRRRLRPARRRFPRRRGGAARRRVAAGIVQPTERRERLDVRRPPVVDALGQRGQPLGDRASPSVGDARVVGPAAARRSVAWAAHRRAGINPVAWADAVAASRWACASSTRPIPASTKAATACGRRRTWRRPRRRPPTRWPRRGRAPRASVRPGRPPRPGTTGRRPGPAATALPAPGRIPDVDGGEVRDRPVEVVAPHPHDAAAEVGVTGEAGGGSPARRARHHVDGLARAGRRWRGRGTGASPRADAAHRQRARAQVTTSSPSRSCRARMASVSATGPAIRRWTAAVATSSAASPHGCRSAVARSHASTNSARPERVALVERLAAEDLAPGGAGRNPAISVASGPTGAPARASCGRPRPRDAHARPASPPRGAAARSWRAAAAGDPERTWSPAGRGRRRRGRDRGRRRRRAGAPAPRRRR